MKGLVETFIRRPVTSLMIVCGIVLLGTVSLSRLPVGLLPNLASPGITVITRYPGVAAQKIDEVLTVPIERQVSDIAGIEHIQSVSSEGESRINLIFSQDVEIKARILDATERISIIRQSFPREVDEPYIIQYDPSDRPVFIVSFSSDRYDLKRLREIIDRSVKPKFEQVDGVSEVFVGGGYEREIQVIIDPSRLMAHGIAAGPVSQAVAEGNVYIPGGRPAEHFERNIYTNAKFRSIAEMQELLLAGPEGKLLSLSQVADVRDFYRDRDTIAKTNGEERVTIYVEKAGSANTLALTEQCVKITSGLRLAGVRQQVSFNQGEKIREAVNRVTEACFVGGFVVMLVLYGFLGRPKETLVIVLSLPVSVFATFFLMFLSGLELNVMSLSGLALGSGMLIDNSIVVSESIQSHRERLGDSFEAVLKGTTTVFAEVIAATLCTLVVFIPLLFTEPETRRLYSGLSITVVYSLLVSLFVALTITPCFLFVVMRRSSATNRPKGTLSMREFFRFVARRIVQRLPARAAGVLRFVSRAAVLIRREASIERMVCRYRISIRPVFRRPYVTLAVPLILLALMPLIFRTLKKEYFDPLDSGDLEASIDLETGTDLSRTEKIVTGIETSVRESSSVKEVTAKIEKWHASMNIKLSERGKRDGQEAVIRDLKARTAKFSEAFVYFAGSDESGGREFNIDFYGDDLKVLKSFASELSTKLRAGIPGVEQAVLRFREPKGEILIEPSRTALARSGTTTSEVGSAVRNFLSGAVITKFYDKDREVDVRFRAGGEVYDTPEKLRSLVVPLTGRSVPLRSIAEFREDTGETKIWRKNKRKSVSITLRLGDVSMDKTAEDVEAYFKTIEFPKDTIYGFGEEYEKLKAGQRQMLVSILLSFVILYMLLAALFESMTKPLLILLPVPLTVCGVLVLFAVLRMSLNMGTYIGMIMLGGIATNNSILLVSTVFRRTAGLRAPGESLIRHVLHAASTRIRPVLMTTMSTALGMTPMIFDFGEGSGMWRPLALTVSSGLVFSLLVSLVLVPFAAYHYLRFFVPKSTAGEV